MTRGIAQECASLPGIANQSAFPRGRWQSADDGNALRGRLQRSKLTKWETTISRWASGLWDRCRPIPLKIAIFKAAASSSETRQ
jgi:hypothetical protein